MIMPCRFKEEFASSSTVSITDPPGSWWVWEILAKSKDGYHWEKPVLGIVEYGGSKNNNLVDIVDGGHVQAAVVFYEPEDPDPKRRFKICFESDVYKRKALAVAFSEDGLRWDASPRNPVGPHFEQAGGTKFGGVYFINGQGSGGHWTPKGGVRALLTHISYDFENWSDASCLGLRRDPLPPRPTEYGLRSGPQVHLGAALWNRGNILVGFYGMWNGHPTDDRRLASMHLGLAVSHDGLHFTEPVPDFPIVSASEIGYERPPDGAEVRYPALIQGQGFENIGDETLFWYSPWPEGRSDGVRVATWQRDRLGCFRPFVGPKDQPYIISAPLDPEGRAVKVSINVDGLSEYAGVRVSVLDEKLRPLQDYGRLDALVIRENGLAQSVGWKKSNDELVTDRPFRLRVDFEGARPEDIRLFAIYID